MAVAQEGPERQPGQRPRRKASGYRAVPTTTYDSTQAHRFVVDVLCVISTTCATHVPSCPSPCTLRSPSCHCCPPPLRSAPLPLGGREGGAVPSHRPGPAAGAAPGIDIRYSVLDVRAETQRVHEIHRFGSVVRNGSGAAAGRAQEPAQGLASVLLFYKSNALHLCNWNGYIDLFHTPTSVHGVRDTHCIHEAPVRKRGLAPRKCSSAAAPTCPSLCPSHPSHRRTPSRCSPCPAHRPPSPAQQLAHQQPCAHLEAAHHRRVPVQPAEDGSRGTGAAAQHALTHYSSTAVRDRCVPVEYNHTVSAPTR